MSIEWVQAFWGGILIGVSVSLMLLWHGRVTGISGILYGTINPVQGDKSWRFYFLSGLFIGGLTLYYLKPDSFNGSLPTSNWTVVTAGLLVGFGTVLGSGCTSGHGVCGISRLSRRSLVATMLFIGFGILSVFALKKVGILP
ncbi:MAG TPA: YeeE/YedE family protein [Legionella sp.]|nr:YeeE/YedE family protein [Legionella sp.]